MIWELRIEQMSTHRIKPKYVTNYGRRIKVKTRTSYLGSARALTVF